MTNNRRNRRRHAPYFSIGCFIIPFIILVFLIGSYFFILSLAQQSAGPISEKLSAIQKLQYSGQILWYDGLLTMPAEPSGLEGSFIISEGDGALTVAINLQQAGYIQSADAFVAYLIYSGADTKLQMGEFQISPALTPIQIALKLQDPTPTRLKFVVLPGWRLEEVANAMPTSGLNITKEQFMEAVNKPAVNFDFLDEGTTAEGFLFPGEYTVPREISAKDLVTLLMNQAALALSPEIRAGFAAQNLNVYQAVTLASIVQREAVAASEQPQIASVFLNRLMSGMRLETDPTIQYSIGYDSEQKSWWKVPLTQADLAFDSTYNTYLNFGLPPGPICSPGLSALRAVANPAQTSFLYFRAKCDGSGLHNFSETFDQHLANGCN
ncbi:MAG: endolytic transglycosylase MltG [Chloroflexota bacterium]